MSESPRHNADDAVSPAAAVEYAVVEDGVLRIAISTSANGGALDSDGIEAGIQALRDLDPNVGAILLRGLGDNFCAGGNVRNFAAAPQRGAHIRSVADHLHDFLRLLDAVTVPVVVGVQGWAAGAGMSLVCAADIAIGGPATKMRPAYPGIGLTPDGGMSWRLPRIVGTGRASEILLTDAILGGEEAARLGLLARVVGDAVVEDEALRLARILAAGPRTAYASIKTLLRRSETSTFAEQLDYEAESISAAADGPTGREGVDAFVEKRRPNFTETLEA